MVIEISLNTVSEIIQFFCRDKIADSRSNLKKATYEIPIREGPVMPQVVCAASGPAGLNTAPPRPCTAAIVVPPLTTVGPSIQYGLPIHYIDMAVVSSAGRLSLAVYKHPAKANNHRASFQSEFCRNCKFMTETMGPMGALIGLRQIYQHNLKHNRWAHYASIMD